MDKGIEEIFRTAAKEDAIVPRLALWEKLEGRLEDGRDHAINIPEKEASNTSDGTRGRMFFKVAAAIALLLFATLVYRQIVPQTAPPAQIVDIAIEDADFTIESFEKTADQVRAIYGGHYISPGPS